MPLSCAQVITESAMSYSSDILQRDMKAITETSNKRSKHEKVYLAANNIEHVLKCVESLPEDLCLNAHRKGSVTETEGGCSDPAANDPCGVVMCCLTAMDANVFDLLRLVVNEVCAGVKQAFYHEHAAKKTQF